MESEEEKDRETIRSWLHSVFADLRLPAGAILVRAGVGGGATLNKEGEAWNVGWPSGLYLYLHNLYLYLHKLYLYLHILYLYLHKFVFVFAQIFASLSSLYLQPPQSQAPRWNSEYSVDKWS